MNRGYFILTLNRIYTKLTSVIAIVICTLSLYIPIELVFLNHLKQGKSRE